MANNIGWGQGAVNNAIGWGQGAINNIIGWGSIYLNSYYNETDIVGSPVPTIIINFKTRVLADSGLFEAESCLNTTFIGLGGISDEGLIVFNFQQRVLTDDAIIEAQNCLLQTLNNLN